MSLVWMRKDDPVAPLAALARLLAPAVRKPSCWFFSKPQEAQHPRLLRQPGKQFQRAAPPPTHAHPPATYSCHRHPFFSQEARNILDFYANFENDPNVKIPWVRRDLSGPKVLVMEWIDGIR